MVGIYTPTGYKVQKPHCGLLRAQRLFLVNPQMSGLYTEILDRLDRAKKNLIMEE